MLTHAVRPGKLLYAVGAVRSGKTAACAAMHAVWLKEYGAGKHHAIAGRTASTVLRNFGYPLIDYLRAANCPVVAVPSQGRLRVGCKGGEATVWLFGGDNKDSQSKIRGATLASLHVDELVTIDKDFWPMAWSRLSVPGAKCTVTTNPDNPGHWAKDLMDRVPEMGGRVVNFRLEDNPGLDEEYKRDLVAGLTGHHAARYIDGQWIGASGLVFPRWTACTPADAPKDPTWAVGFDWASAGTTAAVLAACAPDAGRWPEQAVVVSEFRHDARENETLTDEQMLARLRRWTDAETGAPPSAIHVYVDPSTHAGFKVLLREAGYRVRDGDNDVLPGIATTDARLTAGNIRVVADACPGLVRELRTYAWDEKAAERKTDAPVKSDDHAVDALRYWAHTTAQPSGLAEWAASLDLDP